MSRKCWEWKWCRDGESVDDVDHGDVTRLQGVETVDRRLQRGDRLGKVILAIVPWEHIHDDLGTHPMMRMLSPDCLSCSSCFICQSFIASHDLFLGFNLGLRFTIIQIRRIAGKFHFHHHHCHRHHHHLNGVLFYLDHQLLRLIAGLKQLRSQGC